MKYAYLLVRMKYLKLFVIVNVRNLNSMDLRGLCSVPFHGEARGGMRVKKERGRKGKSLCFSFI